MRLRFFAAALLVLAACSKDDRPSSVPTTATAPPNIVLIVVDTLRADHADSALGRAAMPNLERLARDGVRFERAFSHVPMTLPSHVSLFSSRYPLDSGVRLNGQRVGGELPMFSGWLAQHGYRSQAVVSLATLWPLEKGASIDRGFADFAYDAEIDCTPAERVNAELATLLDGPKSGPLFLFAHYSDPHDPYSAHGSANHTVEVLFDGKPVQSVSISEVGFLRAPLRLPSGRRALELRGTTPFRIRMLEVRSMSALMPTEFNDGALHRDLPHASIDVSNSGGAALECELWLWLEDALTSAESAARYRLECEYADREIGLFLDDLARRGLYDSSLIVLTSDHGEALGEHGHVGHVVDVYDESLRVPLIIKVPRGSPARARLEGVKHVTARLIDVVPTMLDLAGLPELPGQAGASLLSKSSRVVFAETHAPLAPRTQVALRDERFKLIFEPQAETFAMFDLAEDPGETRDVFSARGAERIEWQAKLRDLGRRALATQAAPDPAALRALNALGY